MTASQLYRRLVRRPLGHDPSARKNHPNSHFSMNWQLPLMGLRSRVHAGFVEHQISEAEHCHTTSVNNSLPRPIGVPPNWTGPALQSGGQACIVWYAGQWRCAPKVNETPWRGCATLTSFAPPWFASAPIATP